MGLSLYTVGERIPSIYHTESETILPEISPGLLFGNLQTVRPTSCSRIMDYVKQYW